MPSLEEAKTQNASQILTARQSKETLWETILRFFRNRTKKSNPKDITDSSNCENEPEYGRQLVKPEKKIGCFGSQKKKDKKRKQIPQFQQSEASSSQVEEQTRPLLSQTVGPSSKPAGGPVQKQTSVIIENHPTPTEELSSSEVTNETNTEGSTELLGEPAEELPSDEIIGTNNEVAEGSIVQPFDDVPPLTHDEHLSEPAELKGTIAEDTSAVPVVVPEPKIPEEVITSDAPSLEIPPPLPPKKISPESKSKQLLLEECLQRAVQDAVQKHKELLREMTDSQHFFTQRNLTEQHEQKLEKIQNEFKSTFTDFPPDLLENQLDNLTRQINSQLTIYWSRYEQRVERMRRKITELILQAESSYDDKIEGEDIHNMQLDGIRSLHAQVVDDLMFEFRENITKTYGDDTDMSFLEGWEKSLMFKLEEKLKDILEDRSPENGNTATAEADSNRLSSTFV